MDNKWVSNNKAYYSNSTQPVKWVSSGRFVMSYSSSSHKCYAKTVPGKTLWQDLFIVTRHVYSTGSSNDYMAYYYNSETGDITIEGMYSQIEAEIFYY